MSGSRGHGQDEFIGTSSRAAATRSLPYKRKLSKYRYQWLRLHYAWNCAKHNYRNKSGLWKQVNFEKPLTCGPSVVALQLPTWTTGDVSDDRDGSQTLSPHSSAAAAPALAAILFVLRVGPITVSGPIPSAPPPTPPHLCLVCTQTQRDAACNHRRTQFQGQFQGYLLSGVNKKRKKTQRAKRKKEVGVEKKWMVIKNGSENIFFLK